MTCYINIYKHHTTYDRHECEDIVAAAEDCQMQDRTEYKYLHTFKVVDDRIKQKMVLEYDDIIAEAQADWDAYRDAGTLSAAQTWQT